MTTSAPRSSQADLPAQYDPQATERALYARWAEAGVFTARAERTNREGGSVDPFVIMMPPPNVTAILHVGHGLNLTVQDVLTRWRRMAGDEALWLPGTDHAGIATQNVIEKQLAGEGKTRFDLGRDAFVARTAEFVRTTGGEILEQIKAIGGSCDWSRTRYTLSPELSVAVREAFVRLYEDGLIYRGHRVIHWCPRCLTSLSDEEAEHEEEEGKLYHIMYSLADDPSQGLTVATTRPETLLGDVAVAVNPDDDRYRDLVGKYVMLPVANVRIPVIADAYADPAFGTGVVKITPAHDANDFEVGVRHKLPMPVVITPEGTMGEVSDASGRVPAELREVDRFEARKRIVEQLRDEGQLVRVENHRHSVRHCYRCDTVVEPRLSDQWFVKMKPLAAPALDAVRSGRTRILPERWEAVYVNWLEGIRDWNISRQLWWGHRVPVFYCDDCNWQDALREDPNECPTCGGGVRQDDDVLDTWFSSWLWPMSTLGWPDEQSRDLKVFYPGDVLVTAPEILFFWVARMIMSGYRFMGDAPFHTVYLHGTARDTQHRKMSKSLGNGIDPLDVVAQYGADALRWTIVSSLGMGADAIFDPADLEKTFAPGRNFATKLWNIARFLLGQAGEDSVRPLAAIAESRLTRADRWILERLDVAIAECDAALGPARPANGTTWPVQERQRGMRLNEYAESARRFVWNELADWYLEVSKARLQSESDDREVARAVLVHAFDRALRLLHPIVPFITEALWQRLPGQRDSEFIARAPWPKARGISDAAAAEFETVRDAVVRLRQQRSAFNIPERRPVTVHVDGASQTASTLLREESATIERLSWSRLAWGDPPAGTPNAKTALAGGGTAAMLLDGNVDVAKERARFARELEELEKQLGALEKRLANPGFVQKAKPEVVGSERQKLTQWTSRRAQLAALVQSLGGA
ncbi:MAG TPA: valine--tRNA ligase [Gemmatimonadaceae bacterium]|nr:valine--tRNA ligase [Gemmatimonadaceae bacterium]